MLLKKTKLKAAPLNIFLFFKKTKNTRMGKGRGGVKCTVLKFASSNLFLTFSLKSWFFYFSLLKNLKNALAPRFKIAMSLSSKMGSN